MNDKIYPLKDAASYSGRDYIDMVLYVPRTEDNTRRLWLLTEAKSPKIMVDHFEFKPIDPVPHIKVQNLTGNRAERYRWIDFGMIGLSFFKTDRFFKGNFKQIKFKISRVPNKLYALASGMDLITN